MRSKGAVMIGLLAAKSLSAALYRITYDGKS